MDKEFILKHSLRGKRETGGFYAGLLHRMFYGETQEEADEKLINFFLCLNLS